MSNWLEKIPPRLAAALLDSAKVIATHVWNKLSGDEPSKGADVIDDLKRRALDGALAALQDELEFQAAKASLDVQLAALGPLAEDVVSALETARATKPMFAEGKPDADGWISLESTVLPDGDGEG